jgi:hypothetical protein
MILFMVFRLLGRAYRQSRINAAVTELGLRLEKTQNSQSPVNACDLARLKSLAFQASERTTSRKSGTSLFEID